MVKYTVLKKGILYLLGLLMGVGLGWGVTYAQNNFKSALPKFRFAAENILGMKKEVIGFLPYWLLDKAQTDYGKYISTLTYFSLTLDGDGTIKKYTAPGETEPGWYSLSSGRAEPFLTQAAKDKIKLSLLVFAGNNDTIAELIADPITHAQQMLADVKPVLQEYGFADLNLDIENIGEASDEARMRFGQFVAQVRTGLDKNISLSLEVTGDDLVKKKLIDVAKVSQAVDKVIIMAYDYHSPGSAVTGPVAPLGGGGTISEYDVQTAVKEAAKIMPNSKIILGMPLYGYEWETIGETPRSGIVPGTGMTASNQRVETLLKECTECSKQTDEVAQEAYVIFTDKDTGTVHQIFYPDSEATRSKVNFAITNDLGGLAVWALGYEGTEILKPLSGYLVK